MPRNWRLSIMKRNKAAASIMCANQLQLKEELQHLEKAGIELLHCDVMDGVFVNNLAMGPYVLEEIKQATSIPLDIHLATENPTHYIKMFASLKPEYISFHIESSNDVLKDIELLRSENIKPALAISPETPIAEIVPYLGEIDMILLMTVNPGFSGQQFNYKVLEKLDELTELIKKLPNQPLIEVDGNINEQTIPVLAEKGANIFVLGTSQLFNTKPGTYTEKVAKVNELI